MHGIKYHLQSGEIILHLTAYSSEQLQAQAGAEYGVAEIEDNVTSVDHWYTGNQIQNRQTITPTVSKRYAAPGENITITNLPNACWLFNSQTMTTEQVTGGAKSYSASSPISMLVRVVGRYKFDVELHFDELASVQNEAKLTIDTLAEDARNRVVTPGSGQAMTYIRKAEVARIYIANGVLSSSAEQRLEDEASRLGVSIADAATAIVAIADQWEAIDAAIDNIRLTSKKAVDDATSANTVHGILNAITWPV